MRLLDCTLPWLLVLASPGGCAREPAQPGARVPEDLLLVLGLSEGPGLEAGLRPLLAGLELPWRPGLRDPSGQGALELLGCVCLARHAGRASLLLARVPDRAAFLAWQRGLGRVVTQAGGRLRVYRSDLTPHAVYRAGARALVREEDEPGEPAGPILEAWSRGALWAVTTEEDVSPAEVAWALELAGTWGGGPGRVWLRASPEAFHWLLGEELSPREFYWEALAHFPLEPARREALARWLAGLTWLELEVELGPQAWSGRLRFQPVPEAVGRPADDGAAEPSPAALLGAELARGLPIELEAGLEGDWGVLRGRISQEALLGLLAP
jgi:hypothetical protein